MKTYYVDVRWAHKGMGYPRDAHVRVKGTSLATAANKAVKLVKKTNNATWREPVGATIRVNIYIVDNGKEANDGRGIRDEQQEEP